MRRIAMALGVPVLLAASAGVAAAAPGRDAPTRVWEVEGSNMGICSSFLGQTRERDDVNRLIREFGDLLGIGSPGELYRVRAQQAESRPPAEECIQRRV